MFLRDLPLDIQYNILEHCSPSDLAVLSRLHTSVRDVAEYALYGHIRYCAQPLNMIVTVPSQDSRAQVAPQRLHESHSPLHTLATNSRKASMVKALHVELKKGGSRDGDVVRFVLVKLAEALEKMPNLMDLRIIYSPTKDLFESGISQVIRSGYFKLHTLYLEHSHDLEGIIADQPQLRLLGIYFALDILHMDLWTKIEQLYQSPSRRRAMPVVFMLSHLPYYGPRQIHMLPSFHRPEEALQVCQEIAASLNKWRDGFDGNIGYQLSLSLIGISEKDISLLDEAIRAMAACRRDYYPRDSEMYPCMNIILHEKYIQKPWRFPEFVKPMGLFEDLQGLFFILPDVEKDAILLLSTDLKLSVNLGRGTWPTIQHIMLQGQTVEENILLGREYEEGEDEMQTESEDED